MAIRWDPAERKAPSQPHPFRLHANKFNHPPRRSRRKAMSRKAQVVCFLAIVLVGTAAFGQTARCPTPSTYVSGVQSDKVSYNWNVNYTSPQAAFILATTNALKVLSTTGPSGSTQVSDTSGTHTVSWSTTTSGTSATTTISGLPPNTTYQATVTIATPTCTTSLPSAPVVATTAPPPPTSISGLGGLNKVTVSWANAMGASSYQLTLSNGMSFTAPAGLVTIPSGKTGTSFVVTGLQTATSYNAIVASINSAGVRGSFSQAVVVRTANVALQ
jgi:hypothetical protein